MTWCSPVDAGGPTASGLTIELGPIFKENNFNLLFFTIIPESLY